MARSFKDHLRRSWRDFTFRPAVSLCLFEEGFSFDLFGFFIPLMFLNRWRWEPHEIMERWGVYLYGEPKPWKFDSIWFCWGRHTKSFYMPWQWEHYSWEVRRADGTWVKRVACYEKGEPDGREVFVEPYHYTLKSGEVQIRTATIHVERGQWRRRWTYKLPWFALVRTSIDVTFSDEVGERTGSWKGGTIGCGYDLRPGETAVECLRRMESERKF